MRLPVLLVASCTLLVAVLPALVIAQRLVEVQARSQSMSIMVHLSRRKVMSWRKAQCMVLVGKMDTHETAMIHTAKAAYWS